MGKNSLSDIKKNLDADEMFKFDPASLMSFKNKVKEWLKNQGKSHKWLALNINKSAGSVKNWLYTPLNITSENARAILRVIETYERGGELLSLAPKATTLGWLPIGGSSLEFDPPNYKAWSMASEIPHACFRDRHPADGDEEVGFIDETNAIKLAEWVSNTLNEAAANLLRPIYGENGAKTFEAFSGYMDRLGDTVASPDKNRKVGNSRAYDLRVWEDTEEMEAPLIEILYLPVIMEKWQSMLIDVAVAVHAKRAGDKLDNCSSRRWIISTLNKEAKKQFLANLEALLNENRD